MESHHLGPSAQLAESSLTTLAADRERLVRQIRIPWALMAAFGALGAWWVGTAATTTPGVGYEPNPSHWLALVGVLVVAHLLQRETGLRFAAIGPRAGWALAGIVLVWLTLFSVSLGLVSLSLGWGVWITSAAAFALTTWLAGLAYRFAVDRLRRD